MPRARPPAAATSKPKSTTTKLKRTSTLPPTTTTTTTTSSSRRSSTRHKSSPSSVPIMKRGGKKTTPKKSPFFAHGSDAEEGSETESESEIENEGSGYEDEDASLVESEEEEEEEEESEPEDEDEDDSGDGGKKKKRKRTGKAGAGKNTKNKKQKTTSSAVDAQGNVKVSGAKGEKGKELWREGVKSHLAPGEEIFVRLPKARGDGGVKYRENEVHPNTLLFLGDLAENNERGWLKVHDASYRQAKKNWDDFVDKMTEKIIEIDDTIPELPPKDLTFRIYRDVRFSSDPTPYKTHFSAAWSRTGRKGPYAAYYLQIKPGGHSFLGGGLWCPDSAPLAALRRMIDKDDARKLTEVLMAPAMRREFLGWKREEGGVVEAFCRLNKENALKTRPKVS